MIDIEECQRLYKEWRHANPLLAAKTVARRNAWLRRHGRHHHVIEESDFPLDNPPPPDDT